MAYVRGDGSLFDEEVHGLMAGDYWSNHPKYTQDRWQIEVAEGNTLSGYWDWVQNQIELEG